MRIVLALTLAVMFAAIAGSVGRSAHAADQRISRAPAQLKVTSTQPIAVRGTAFRAAERVTLVLRMTTNAMWTKSTTASRAGVLNVTFPAARAGHCTGFTVRATGSRGSTATFHRIPLPACSPA